MQDDKNTDKDSEYDEFVKDAEDFLNKVSEYEDKSKFADECNELMESYENLTAEEQKEFEDENSELLVELLNINDQIYGNKMMLLSVGENSKECGDLIVSSDHVISDGEISYSGRVITFNSGAANKNYTISMKEGTTSTSADKVVVNTNDTVNITINNINITSLSDSPFKIKGGSQVNLYLEKENTLQSSSRSYAGLQIQDSSSVTIDKTSNGESHVLNATGGNNASGIGTGENPATIDSINITGGTVNATGGENGAGIGTGTDGKVGAISITGGKVTAKGENAGIGSGNGYWSTGKVSEISITGGTTIAEGKYALRSYTGKINIGTTANVIGISESSDNFKEEDLEGTISRCLANFNYNYPHDISKIELRDADGNVLSPGVVYNNTNNSIIKSITMTVNDGESYTLFEDDVQKKFQTETGDPQSVLNIAPGLNKYYASPEISIDDITVEGKVGQEISSVDAVIKIKNGVFSISDIHVDDDVTSFIPNMPAGLTAKVKSLTDGNKTLTLTVTGTPTAASNSEVQANFTIGSKTYAVNNNPNAKFNIKENVNLWNAKFLNNQVFDCYRSPSFPIEGRKINISHLTNAKDKNGSNISWSANDYVEFKDTGKTVAELPDADRIAGIISRNSYGITKEQAKNSAVVSEILYAQDGTKKKELASIGVIWAFDKKGFLYTAFNGAWESTGGVGTFVTSEGKNNGSSVSYVPSLSRPCEPDDLTNNNLFNKDGNQPVNDKKTFDYVDRVVDDSVNPVQNADVEVTYDGNTYHATTDSDGYFEVDNIEKGTGSEVSVKVEKDGHQVTYESSSIENENQYVYNTSDSNGVIKSYGIKYDKDELNFANNSAKKDIIINNTGNEEIKITGINSDEYILLDADGNIIDEEHPFEISEGSSQSIYIKPKDTLSEGNYDGILLILTDQNLSLQVKVKYTKESTQLVIPSKPQKPSGSSQSSSSSSGSSETKKPIAVINTSKEYGIISDENVENNINRLNQSDVVSKLYNISNSHFEGKVAIIKSADEVYMNIKCEKSDAETVKINTESLGNSGSKYLYKYDKVSGRLIQITYDSSTENSDMTEVNMKPGDNIVITSVKKDSLTNNMWNNKAGKWLYVKDMNVVSGWFKDTDSTWYHMNNDGVMQKGWYKDTDTKWYYLESSGAMKTGWYKDTDGKWYHLNNSGAMDKGWLKDSDGKWYYLNDDGSMAKDTIIGGYKVGADRAWIN